MIIRSADPYLYLLLGGMCELPAYLLLWLLVAHAGRRPSLSGLYLLCAACIAANAALMFTTPDGEQEREERNWR